MKQVYHPLEFITKNHELIASCLDTLENSNLNNNDSIALVNKLLEKYDQFNLNYKSLLITSDQENAAKVDLKLRIVASIAGIQNIADPCIRQLDINYTDINNGSIAYCIYDNYLVLIPPTIHTEGEEQRLLAGLELLFETYSTRYDWLVDCSSMKRFSGLTFSNLIYYQEKLSGSDNSLLIFWLNAQMLPSMQMKILRQVFRLHEIGGQFFSNFKHD